RSSQKPKRAQISEQPRAVRVIPAPLVSVVPRAIGYGKVQPGQVWQAVAEVGGTIVEIHPDLKRGSLIAKGEILLRIDPSSYDLAQSRGEAGVKELQAQFRELEQKEKNINRSLKVEKSSLELSKKELDRRLKLAKAKIISKSEVDQEEKRFLAQQAKVQDLQNTFDRIPSQKQALSAKISSARSRVKDTQLDLGKTTIRAPFNCRVSEVNVELSQYAQPGKVLAEVYDIGSSEILAQMPLSVMKPLIDPGKGQLIATEVDTEILRKALGLSAVVRLNVGGETIEWKGRFSRPSETLDPQTGTVGMYVVVEDTYRQARFGVRPPLIKNMYCEVELRGKPRPKSVVIPRSALHQGIVYIVGPQNRLERRSVTVDYSQGNLVSIKKGIAPGEKVVVTDIIPAIEGMLLAPQTDNDLLTSLIALATGEAPVK
ncbi:MAG: HlyD family efflux transporter periplasmic adaptor subunit, partial [Desulfobacteraceae bacterium]|nr:HlyD family efflux transporter periplasmic adaptor subunit [Desulfobacteraceae bacterium]